MAEYKYRAMSKKGKGINGRMEETSKYNVIKKLKEHNLVPLSIKKVDKISFTKKIKKRNAILTKELLKIQKSNVNRNTNILQFIVKNRKVKRKDVLVFTQNFYLLKKSNFTNVQALLTILNNTENNNFKEIVEDILAGIESGEKIYTTLEYYSKIFPFIYINIIKVGELSGSLTNALYQALVYMEESEKLGKQLRGILLPNILSTISILLMTFFGVLFGVPQLQKIYESTGYKIPAPTQMFFELSTYIVLYWYVFVGIIVGLIFFLQFYKNQPKGKYRIDMAILKMPVFGKLITRINLSKYFQAVLLNLKNGSRLQDSLDIGKDVLSNYVLLSIIEAAKNNLLLGYSWVQPFEDSDVIPVMVTDMLKIGMETDITEMIEKIYEYIQQDIDNTIKDIIKALPQVTYGIVGIFIIVFVLIIMVPLIDLSMGNFIPME